MAANRQVRYRQADTGRIYRERYVYGNAVRQPEELPYRRQDKPEGTRRTSGRVAKNRRRALDISPAYVLFLAAVCVCALLACVAYLRLQCELAQRAENITLMQKELAELTEQNDTAYSVIADSVNLQEVRDKAVNELGMVYAPDGRVEEYVSPAKGYVVQYNDIPCDGILAKSKSVTD